MESGEDQRQKADELSLHDCLRQDYISSKVPVRIDSDDLI